MIRSEKNIELPSGFEPGFAVEIELKRGFEFDESNYDELTLDLCKQHPAKVIRLNQNSVRRETFDVKNREEPRNNNKIAAAAGPHNHESIAFLSGSSSHPTIVFDSPETVLDATVKMIDEILKGDLKDFGDWNNLRGDLMSKNGAAFAGYHMDKFGHMVKYDIGVNRELQRIISKNKKVLLKPIDYGATLIKPRVMHARALVDLPDVRVDGDEIYISSVSKYNLNGSY